MVDIVHDAFLVKTLRRYWLLIVVSMLWAAQGHSADLMPTVEDVQALESQLAATTDVPEATRSSLTTELSQARQQLDDLQVQTQELKLVQQQAASFDVDVQRLQKEIQALTQAPTVEPPLLDNESALSAESARQELSVRQLRRALFEARELEAWLSRRADLIGRDMTEVAKRFNQAGNRSITGPSSWQSDSYGEEGSSITLRARALIDHVNSQVASERFSLLQQELATLAPRQTLASLTGRSIRIRLENQSQTVEQHWRLLTKVRTDAVQARIARLIEDSDSTDSFATSQIDEPVRWAKAELVLLEQELAVLLRTAKAADSITQIYQVRQLLFQINSTGALNDSLTDMIRTLREQLPDSVALSAELQALRTRQRSLQVDRILWESALRGDRASSSVGTVDVMATPQTSNSTLSALVTLLGVANRVSDRMTSLEAVLFEAQTRTDEVASTLDGSVLWLRSNDAATLSWISNGYDGLRWMANSERWAGASATLFNTVQKYPLPLLAMILILLTTITLRPRVRRMLTDSATGVGNVGEDRYWSSPTALLASSALALPLPLALFIFHWALKDGFFVQGSLIPALSGALLATASVLAVLLFFKTLCRDDGLFRRHFEWDERSVDRLYRHLKWFVWVCALCTAVFTFALLSGQAALRYGLAVLAFVIVSVAMSVLLYECLRPGQGIALTLTHTTTQSPFTRLGIWVLIAVPAIVGLLPLAGYFDIAVEIQNRAFTSGVYLMITAVLIGLAIREFMVAHRRMSLRKARARRAAREAERTAQVNAPVSGDATPDLSFAWDDDHQRIARQAQKLLKTAGVILFVFIAWLVWKPLFPVLDVFNDIVLWRAQVGGDSATANQAITLGKLLFALGIVVLGVIGSRNLRGVLEILVFESLQLDTGARYAINAIASYALVGTALLVGIGQLGVDWSRLQWIVAALGVGLGFGLQEIVANFISGLIILFERPVRVGDTVTIGGLSGTVSNIQIRATTLTDFDNREVLLPNKSIITENVTNWTLHDAVTRILLSVGVAYGSDVDQVTTLLIDCVNTTEDVLSSPEPTVFFVNHGTSSLDFEIRAFVATPAHRLPVTHALNKAIYMSLSTQGIEIPFPQQVVHMHTVTDSVT